MTGQELRAARLRAGLTQEHLAQRAGITVTTISRIERGHSHASPAVRRLLAMTLPGLDST